MAELLPVHSGRCRPRAGSHISGSNEDKYSQLDGCNVRHGTAAALTELLDRLEARFAGYTAYFGFPGENREAADFLRARGFDCVERDWNFSFFFDGYTPAQCARGIEKIPAGTLAFSAPYTAQSLTRTGAVTPSLTRWTIRTSSFTAKAPPPPRQYFSPAARYYEIYGTCPSPTALSGMPFPCADNRGARRVRPSRREIPDLPLRR